MEPFIQLHSDLVSLVIKLRPAPEVLYWGKRINTIAQHQWPEFVTSQQRAVPQARLDHDVPLTLCPELGRGSFGSSGLEGHRQGLASMPRFDYVSHSQHTNQVEILCQDSLAQLSLSIQLELHPTGTLTKRIQLTN